MPTTRKKVIKIIYKDENSDEETGDFSDSGSEAKISGVSSSDDEEIEYENSSADEFQDTSKNYKTSARRGIPKKTGFTKALVKKIHKQNSNEDKVDTPALFSVKDLTEADKLLPTILNLSESDSSDDESPQSTSRNNSIVMQPMEEENDIDKDVKTEYKDVWSNNVQVQDHSEEIAKKTFKELEQHKTNIEETKAALQNYTLKIKQQDSDVKDLLAMGEEVPSHVVDTITMKPKFKRRKDDSESEIEDWEEVKETKEIPQQGLQLFVEFPDAGCRKSKKIDVEMMMKRKMNRVKKEYQVFMHKVHVLCWLGHGNYISRILNDQELMAAALTLVPSKECYPGERVDMKYVEQITTWYRDKLSLKLDKNEDKFKPKAPPLKNILLDLIKKKVVSTNKYLVFIFVAMLRALGLQCRVMFNFVTLPIKPPVSELCSLSTKPKDKNTNTEKSITSTVNKTKTSNTKEKSKPKESTSKSKPKIKNIAQIDGNYDSHSTDDEMQVLRDDYVVIEQYENIMQIDGNDDSLNTKRTRSSKRLKADVSEKVDEEDVSPPKIQKKNLECHSPKSKIDADSGNKRTQRRKKTGNTNEKFDEIDNSAQTHSSNLKTLPKTSKRVQKSQIGDSNLNKPSRTGKNTDTVNITNSKCEEIDNCSKTQGSDLKALPRTSKRVQKSQIENNNHNEPTRTSKRRDTINITNPKCDDIDTNSKTFSSNLKASSKTSKRIQKSELKNSNCDELQRTGKDMDTVNMNVIDKVQKNNSKKIRPNALNVPNISITDENNKDIASKFFEDTKSAPKFSRLTRKRSQTANPEPSKSTSNIEEKGKIDKAKGRTKSAPGTDIEKSKYFKHDKTVSKTKMDTVEDKQRISHRDLAKKSIKKDNSDVTGDLIDIMKNRIKNAKLEAKKGLVKGKIKEKSDEDSDFLPVEDSKRRDSDDDFKPKKVSPKPSTSRRRIDRRVISSSPDEEPTNKKSIDVWCEIFVEELEQWISVDVVKGKIHSISDIYRNATHPVCYVVAWDNNNCLKDLTRKYVPHYNTVTRKLRAEPLWWDKSVQPYLGPKTARDREEDEYLNRMQLEAPLPKSISEYKNHPLYALTRHLLKFEAIYPPDAPALGFIRSEPVYARECVYVCRSRDTWLKEAKVVKLGEKPYKVVKARPKWDRLSNKLITDKPLEVFGPWQVQDYEPPVAENGIVPRNAYGNVELFKQCMLPKGTVHIKLPGLNRVARKLNIDCAPAMTGFDFNGGWSHPVYDGFIVCQEFEEIVTDAWVKDQEEQERRELEKTELRVYGNWKRLIRGLIIRERLKDKYGFEKPTTSETGKGKKGPRLVVKKKT